MIRARWIGASVVVTALTIAGCGSSGPKTMSEDDFVSAIERVCRQADRDFNKLDPSDSRVFDDGIDITQTALDSFEELNPPQSLANDFDDFKDNLDDHITQLEKLKRAVKNSDNAAIEEASAKLEDLDNDADDLADSMGADRCVAVGETDSEPTDTAPDTTTANTPLPIDTSPVETSPPPTEAPSTDAPASGDVLDASQFFEPPDGYTWSTNFDLSNVAPPSNDPTLGPVFNAYYAGALDSTTGGDSFEVYVVELNQDTPWTQEQLDAYYATEFLTDGTDTTTPLGLPARIQLDAATGIDKGAFTLDGVGVAIFGPSGIDVPGLLDAFLSAQGTG
jgi:hypothetical protein